MVSIRHKLVILCLAASGIGAAQQYYGSLTGTVTDPAGAAIVGAAVHVVNLQKNTEARYTTNEDGIYRAPDLTPDAYRIEVEAPGFKRMVREPLLVESSRTLTADVVLEIGAVSESITVMGAPPILESETSQTTSTFEGDMVTIAPLDVGARSDMRTIIAALPGANYGFSGRMLVNGARSSQVAYDNDGLANHSPGGGNMQQESSLSIDSVDSIKFTLVNAGAESRAPAQVSALTKSGSNEFHGSVYLDTMHSIFNANDHNAPAGSEKPFSRLNYEGFQASGPVLLPKIYNGRNRTFFMASLELNQSPGRTAGYITTPSAALRQGDFSDFRDPNGDLIPIIDPLTGDQFPNNRIPAERIYTGSQGYLDELYPQPGRPGYQDNLYLPEFSVSDTTYYRTDIRADHTISSKNNFFFRFSRLANPGSSVYRDFGVGINASQFVIDSWQFTDSHVFSPNIVNEFRVGRSRVENVQYTGQNASEILGVLGIQGIPPILTTDERTGMPDISITGAQYISQVGDGTSGNRLWEVYDNVTHMKGRHSLKYGANFRKDIVSDRSYDKPGTFTFDGTFTGYGLADFLLGLPSTAVRPYPRAAFGPDVKHAWYMGWWLQDDIKVTPQFTLNLGVRWDVNFPGSADEDLYYNFDPATGNLVLPSQKAIDSIIPIFPDSIGTVTAAQAGYPGKLRSTQWLNLAPRIGFAWRPWGDQTVLRAAYGIYTNEISLSHMTGLTWSTPWGGTESFTNRIEDGQPLWQWPDSYPTTEVGDSSFGGTYSAGGYVTNLKNPYTQQWNFTLEHQLEETVFRLQYVGTSSKRLLWLRGGWGDYNTPPPSTIPFDESRRPYPDYGPISYLENGGSAIYHALNVGAERRLRHGVTFNSNFTWSRNFTDSYDGGWDLPDLRYDFGLGDPVWNRRGMRGNQPENPKFKWSTLVYADLPFGRGRWLGSDWNRGLDLVAGGWALSGNLNIETGWWASPLYWGGSDPAGTNFRIGSPDVVGPVNFKNTDLRPGDLFLNPDAFAMPGENIGRYGNSGYTFLQEPTWWTFDMSVRKEFPIYERMRFELDVRMQNAFNHGYYWHRSFTYNMDISDPANFGRFQGNVSGTRVISFVGRFSW